jgi:hypothetical protein
VRILLDENMPGSLRRALAEPGHEVDSVTSLRVKGIDSGRLYQGLAHRYDLCFSKDRAFAGPDRESGAGLGAVEPPSTAERDRI